MTEVKIKKKKLKKGVSQPKISQKKENPLIELYERQEEKRPYTFREYDEEDYKKEPEEMTLEMKRKLFKKAYNLLIIAFTITTLLAITNFQNIAASGIAAQYGNGLALLIYIILEAIAASTIVLTPLALILFIYGMKKLGEVVTN